jgi:hypothetical protein
MTNTEKPDMRDGLPGHGGTIPTGVTGEIDSTDIALNADTKVEPEPDIVSPTIGKNVPEGQTTKG